MPFVRHILNLPLNSIISPVFPIVDPSFLEPPVSPINFVSGIISDNK